MNEKDKVWRSEKEKYICERLWSESITIKLEEFVDNGGFR